MLNIKTVRSKSIEITLMLFKKKPRQVNVTVFNETTFTKKKIVVYQNEILTFILLQSFIYIQHTLKGLPSKYITCNITIAEF